MVVVSLELDEPLGVTVVSASAIVSVRTPVSAMAMLSVLVELKARLALVDDSAPANGQRDGRALTGAGGPLGHGRDKVHDSIRIHERFGRAAVAVGVVGRCIGLGIDHRLAAVFVLRGRRKPIGARRRYDHADQIVLGVVAGRAARDRAIRAGLGKFGLIERRNVTCLVEVPVGRNRPLIC